MEPLKRSQLSDGMYVRMSDVLDDSSFWSRLAKGRIYQIETAATEPDDATCWRPCRGNIIMYGMNYFKQESNDDMYPIPDHVQAILQDKPFIKLKDDPGFKRLLLKGRQIDSLINQIEDAIDRLSAEESIDSNLWEYKDWGHFNRAIHECMSEEELEENSVDIEFIQQSWYQLEAYLDELTALENEYFKFTSTQVAEPETKTE